MPLQGGLHTHRCCCPWPAPRLPQTAEAKQTTTEQAAAPKQQKIYIGFGKEDTQPRSGRQGRFVTDDPRKYPQRTELVGGWVSTAGAAAAVVSMCSCLGAPQAFVDVGLASILRGSTSPERCKEMAKSSLIPGSVQAGGEVGLKQFVEVSKEWSGSVQMLAS